jgi:hypothetical protein
MKTGLNRDIDYKVDQNYPSLIPGTEGNHFKDGNYGMLMNKTKLQKFHLNLVF